MLDKMTNPYGVKCRGSSQIYDRFILYRGLELKNYQIRKVVRSIWGIITPWMSDSCSPACAWRSWRQWRLDTPLPSMEKCVQSNALQKRFRRNSLYAWDRDCCRRHWHLRYLAMGCSAAHIIQMCMFPQLSNLFHTLTRFLLWLRCLQFYKLVKTLHSDNVQIWAQPIIHTIVQVSWINGVHSSSFEVKLACMLDMIN